ncbi:hypothetical protein K435DRAFT_813625 [Dendrothele bispora CBS 962.96]|uniref:Uncharacterized protein n=1 Tax=Dendrothele bispora (strain CBS 962.96) TaxID=1314807 RepID=A0A4S8KL62_DENBC|nr:hypothetical protein K435DRAFT_813625 [Dendrothele bispora CBS 962.96]
MGQLSAPLRIGMCVTVGREEVEEKERVGRTEGNEELIVEERTGGGIIGGTGGGADEGLTFKGITGGLRGGAGGIKKGQNENEKELYQGKEKDVKQKWEEKHKGEQKRDEEEHPKRNEKKKRNEKEKEVMTLREREDPNQKKIDVTAPQDWHAKGREKKRPVPKVEETDETPQGHFQECEPSRSK